MTIELIKKLIDEVTDKNTLIGAIKFYVSEQREEAFCRGYENGKKTVAKENDKVGTIDEDWLEKKMLCFQDRLRTSPGSERTHCTVSKCQNDECCFCFPCTEGLEDK